MSKRLIAAEYVVTSENVVYLTEAGLSVVDTAGSHMKKTVFPHFKHVVEDMDKIAVTSGHQETVIACICWQQADKTLQVPFSALAEMPQGMELEISVDRSTATTSLSPSTPPPSAYAPALPYDEIASTLSEYPFVARLAGSAWTEFLVWVHLLRSPRQCNGLIDPTEVPARGPNPALLTRLRDLSTTDVESASQVLRQDDPGTILASEVRVPRVSARPRLAASARLLLVSQFGSRFPEPRRTDVRRTLRGFHLNRPRPQVVCHRRPLRCHVVRMSRYPQQYPPGYHFCWPVAASRPPPYFRKS